MSQTANVWIIDDDRSIRWVLEKALSQAGLEPRVFETGEGIIHGTAQEPPAHKTRAPRTPRADAR